MKKITLYFIERPILVNFVILLNILFGIFSFYKIPKEAFPGVSLNQIVITTIYPGASAKDVELNVTKTIEDTISEVGGIKEFRSNSVESLSKVTVFANDDLDSSEFRELFNDIQTEIDRVDDLPRGIEGNPTIRSVTTEDNPIMEISFTGTYNNLKNVIPSVETGLRKINGVSNVNTVGLPDEEIHIEVDAVKAIERDIDLNTIYRAIETRNQVGTGGTLESFVTQKKVVSFNKYHSAKDVLSTILRMTADGQGVYLSEVAEVNYKPKDDKLIVRNNGKRGATVLLAIRSGVDQLKVSSQVKKFLKTVKLEKNVSFIINSDVSNKARSKFALLKNNGIIGFVLVVALLYYFLGAKASFWTAFGIPFSVLGSLILFMPFNMTFNTVSMGAFVIVLGMVVDDAMVISERFDTNLELGMLPAEAASSAVDRLWVPVLASSLTTITAFLPLLSLGGLPGKFIWQMPAVVMMALFVSLIDCYLLLPAHLAHGASVKKKQAKKPIVMFVEMQYEKALRTVLSYRYLALGGFLIILAGAAFIGATKLKKDPFPQEASEGFSIKVTVQKGYTANKVEQIIMEIEKSISEIKTNELVGFSTKIGTHSINPLTDYGTEENLVAVIVHLSPYSDRNRTAAEIVSEIKSKVLKSFNGRNFKLEFELQRIGPPLGKPFEIIISSNNDKQREASTKNVISYLNTIDGISEITNDNILGKNEINLKLDYKKVAQAGITSADIIRTLKIAYDGQIVTDFTTVNKSYDFRLRLNESSRGNLDYILNLPVANKRGQLIKMRTMITFEERESVADVKHYDGIRSVSVTGNVDTKIIQIDEVLKKFNTRFKSRDNVKFTLSGRPVEERKIFENLKFAGLLAIVGIYLILSLMFNSYKTPFIIISVIPFGVVGIFLSFYLHNIAISMFAAIGLIGLSGIVVNDSIVLVDHINERMKKAGTFNLNILVRASIERVRPISLTTISTVLAIFPTAYAIGGYDPLLSPLSLAILYGLLFGTIVVLFFVPTLYLLGNDIGNFFKKS